MSCPSESLLLDFLKGSTEPEANHNIEMHIDACVVCRQLSAHILQAGEDILGAHAAKTHALELSETLRTDTPTDGSRPVFARGTPLGRYLILDCVGQGAMGIVYGAYDPKLDRKVALKVLKNSAGVSQDHLLQEARALAKLAHPNVVTVLDVGDVEGHAFLAMEFVEGGTLRAWKEGGVRTWKEVLEVMGLAGRGLAAAHAAKLVHRDFKPDNVLVSGKHVRVTDFGLVHRLEDVALPPPETPVGTPAYMAPEQWAGQPVDFLSDQFSFCIVLHELVYGTRPFQGQSGAELLAQMKLGVPPAPKHARVPGRVHSVLRRGLQFNPKGRFPSMDALLEDLTRVPKATAWRWVSVTAAVTLAGAGAAGWMNRHRALCTGAERKLVGVWDPSVRDKASAAFEGSGLPYARDAWRVSEGILRPYADEWVRAHTEACEATQIRGEQSESMLDARMDCLERRRQELSALTELFLHPDERTIRRATEAARSLSPLAPCANPSTLRMQSQRPLDPHQLAALERLETSVSKLKTWRVAGQHSRGIELGLPVVTEAAALGLDGVSASAGYQVGVMQRTEGAKVASEQTLRKAFLSAEAAGDDSLKLRILTALTLLLANHAQPADALATEVQARAILRRLQNDEEGEAALEHATGFAYYRQAKDVEARRHFERAYNLSIRVHGEEDPRTVGTIEALAMLSAREGSNQEAIRLTQKAAAIHERLYGPMHPATALSIGHVGNALFQAGDFDRSEAAHRRSVAILEQVLGSVHFQTAIALSNLGESLSALRQDAAAVAMFQKAKVALEATAPHHPVLGVVLTNLGRAERKSGHLAAALSVLRRAKEATLRNPTPEPDAQVDMHRELAAALRASGHIGEAMCEFENALALGEKTLGPESPNLGPVLMEWAALDVDMGRTVSAVRHLERAIRLSNDVDNPFAGADARFALAKVLLQQPRGAKRARALATEARSLYASKPWGNADAQAVDVWLKLPELN